jgi:sucrose-phosphate synthase
MKIILISLHGLFRGRDLEIGRDADNGGQIVYVMELARALQSHPDVESVTLLTRLIDDPVLSADYAQPVERVDDKFTIRRIAFGGPRHQLKETLWDDLDEFVVKAETLIRAEGLAPDLLHSHYADAGYAAVALSGRLGCPFVHTGHSLGRRKLEKLLLSGKDREGSMAKFRFEKRFAAEEATLRNSAFVICSTRQEIESYGDYENAGAARYEVFAPGIDLERFAPSSRVRLSEERRRVRRKLKRELSRFLRRPEKPMVLALCRPNQKKNLQGLIAAYATSPQLRAKANLVVFSGQRDDLADMGEAERETIFDMLAQMDRYDLYGQIALPKKHDPGLEVPELYRLAAEVGGVFANVAFDEPFGLTLLEAAASGLPLVATNQGGPTEILQNLGNGLLVDPTDKTAIQQALLKVLSDSTLRRTLAEKGLSRLSWHYGWEAHVAHYVETIKPLIAERPVRAAERTPQAIRRRARFLCAGRMKQAA